MFKGEVVFYLIYFFNHALLYVLRTICLLTWSLNLLITFTHPPLPASSNHQSLLCIYEFEIIQYLSLSDLFPLTQSPQGPPRFNK